MRFHMDGKIRINATAQKTFASLTNPEFMASCIPDVQSHGVIDENHFTAKIRVGIGIVRGTVEMQFAILDEVPPSHAKLIGDGSGAGSKMHIESVFDIVPEGSSNEVTWSADADLSGLIAGIGGPVLKGQSEKQVTKIFQNVKSKLEN
ncbi:MAG: CoxG family protein [Nitrososphaerales archaeon]